MKAPLPPFWRMGRLSAWIGICWMLLLATACGGSDDASDDSYAVVQTAAFTFNETDPSLNEIHVLANTGWQVFWTPEAEGVAVDPAAGVGNGSFRVTDMPAGQTLRFAVRTATGKSIEQYVTVTRAAESSGGEEDEGDNDNDEEEIPLGETLFRLDFGPERSSWVWANQDTGWQTQSGSGAATVRYETYNVQIASPYGSSGRYEGASGGGYARMYEDPSTDYFVIRDITLPAAQTAYTLSFGAIFPAGDMRLEVSADARSWTPLTYTGAAAYNTWTRVVVGFTLARAVERLNIRFVPTGVDREYGLNFDDIVLTAGGGGQTVDPGSTPVADDYRFPELPSNWTAPSGDAAEISGDYAFFTHWTRSVNSNHVIRNFSYCYDTRRHNPVWVAYPLHAVYLEGGYGRTSPDPWAPDPVLDESLQSKIYRSDGVNGSDPYVYWSTNTMYALGLPGSWTKGHLCMSRERGGANREINRQTFYPTNIAPQPNASAATFGEVWGCVESLISGSDDRSNDISADDNASNRNIVADTLFVVAGCHYAHEEWTEYDSSNYNEPTVDPNRKSCVMPTHQFKVLLRTRSGQTGRRVQECSADELQSIGFWVETFTRIDASSVSSALRAVAVPVSTIERQTGLTLFPEVPASVKEQCNPSDWGF